MLRWMVFRLRRRPSASEIDILLLPQLPHQQRRIAASANVAIEREDHHIDPLTEVSRLCANLVEFLRNVRGDADGAQAWPEGLSRPSRLRVDVIRELVIAHNAPLLMAAS